MITQRGKAMSEHAYNVVKSNNGKSRPLPSFDTVEDERLHRKNASPPAFGYLANSVLTKALPAILPFAIHNTRITSG